MTGNVYIDYKDIQVGIEHMPYRKKPCLYLYKKDNNCHYKVASFNSEETADWFIKEIEKVLKKDE